MATKTYYCAILHDPHLAGSPRYDLSTMRRLTPDTGEVRLRYRDPIKYQAALTHQVEAGCAVVREWVESVTQ